MMVEPASNSTAQGSGPPSQGSPPGSSTGPDPAARWYCRVCGADAPDFIPTMSARNRANALGRRHNVIALPCGHEQPDEGGRPMGGLGYGIPEVTGSASGTRGSTERH